MPGKDGTGPLGQGPNLGGAGYGRRAGRGCGQRLRMGREIGFARPSGWQLNTSGQTAPKPTIEPDSMKKERSMLQQQMDSLQTQMNAIQEQLAKLTPPAEAQQP